MSHTNSLECLLKIQLGLHFSSHFTLEKSWAERYDIGIFVFIKMAEKKPTDQPFAKIYPQGQCPGGLILKNGAVDCCTPTFMATNRAPINDQSKV
jgi:hypothetical protein